MWTKTAPTEAGYFWAREGEGRRPEILEIVAEDGDLWVTPKDGNGLVWKAAALGCEWWPTAYGGVMPKEISPSYVARALFERDGDCLIAHFASAHPAGTRFSPFFAKRKEALEYRDLRLKTPHLVALKMSVTLSP